MQWNISERKIIKTIFEYRTFLKLSYPYQVIRLVAIRIKYVPIEITSNDNSTFVRNQK